MRITVAVAILGILAVGCGPKTESGNLTKTYDINLTTTGESFTYVEFILEADSIARMESGDASSQQDPTTALGLQGGTGTIAREGASQTMEGFTDLYKQWMDNRKKDSENQTDNSVTTTPVPIVTPKDPKTPGLGPITESLFALEMVMTEEQPDPEMGFWFTDSELKVEWEGGFWEDKSDEDIAVKKSKGYVGNIMFNPEIPVEATVTKATLTLVLEPDEGQAYGDTESIVEFRDMETGEVIKTFRSGDLIDDPGCAKHIPRCAFDFTTYVQGLR